MNIVIIGPQGSGKGTQADIIAKQYNLTHIESGSVLREKALRDQRLRDMLKVGTIVPDEETLSYIDERLKQLNADFGNIIFDGYPRKVSQYHLLKKYMGNHGFRLDHVLYLEIKDEEAVDRISSRRTCVKCGKVYNLITNPPKNGKCDCGGYLAQREDDTPEAIEKRLKIFHESTEPILELAQKDGILIRIDGSKDIPEVTQEILSKLKK